MTIPTRSIATSVAAPDRPSTKVWWYSSAIAPASASGLRIAGRSAHHHSTARAPNATAWTSLRRIVSHTPSPLSRSGCAERTKISAIRASGAGARLAVRARGVTGRILVVYNLSRDDLRDLEVPLRGRGDGRTRSLGRRQAGSDRGRGRASRDAGAIPRAAVLDPSPLRAVDELPRHARRVHAVPAGRRDHRARGRPGARRQGGGGGQGGRRDLGRGRGCAPRRLLAHHDRRHRPPRGRGRRLADVPHIAPNASASEVTH